MITRIALVNLPFTALDLPSIGLTQLRAVVRQRFGPLVDVQIVYLNHDFASLMPAAQYNFMSMSHPAYTTGLGEWFFRKVAFPDLPDNAPEFLRRYAHVLGKEFVGSYAEHYAVLREHLPAMLDRLIQQHRLHEMDIVGMTSMFQQNLGCFALARRLKNANSDQLVVMGGANCEGSMGIEIVNHVAAIDFVFSGHSLISFPEFVGHVRDRQLDKCHAIDGVFSRKNGCSVATMLRGDEAVNWGRWSPAKQLTGVRALGRELDVNADVELDYDGFLESFSRLPAAAAALAPASILLETSRGCWWGARAHCKFCGLNGQTMAYRAMRADRAVGLIDGLTRRYADRVSQLVLVDNILPLEYFDDVLPRLHTPEHLQLFCEVKADLTEPQVARLAQARFLVIQPGIESLATPTLKLMRKGTTAFKNVRLLQLCRKYGITPQWNLLVGFPGERAETFERYMAVLPSLFHLPPPTGVYPLRFDRFSPYFTEAEEHGLRLAPRDYYGLCYPFAAHVLMNMAYYFSDTNPDAEYALALSSWLQPLQKTVGAWRALWNTDRSRPDLRIKAVGTRLVVEDRRGHDLRTHSLSDAEARLLRSLSAPEREADLATDRQNATLGLRSKKLVFEERGRLMALV